MIGKIIKFFFKLAIGLVIGILIVVWLVNAAVDFTTRQTAPSDNMTMTIYSYNNSVNVPIGEINACPVCGKYFKRETTKYVCCSPECEKEYWELYRAWTSTEKSREYIESHGKQFK